MNHVQLRNMRLQLVHKITNFAISVVTVIWPERARNRGSIPGRGKRFMPLSLPPDEICALPKPLHQRNRLQAWNLKIYPIPPPR